MSFTWFAPKPLRTKEEVAAVVHTVSLRRGLDELATVIALMTIATEVGANDQWWCPANQTNWPDSMAFPHDSLSDDGRSSGYFQQQPGPNGEPWWGTTQNMMTLEEAANTFLDRLSDDYVQADGNPQLAGEFAQRVQQSAFPDRYAAHWDEAWDVLHRVLAPPPAPVITPDPPARPAAIARPDFKEVNLIGVSAISNNSQGRGGRRPDLFLFHTSEGSGGMDLVNFMISHEVSYHYLVDNDRDGNTVYDLVDTDLASWSVLDANNRAINLVIGRSTVEWSRQDWLDNARNAIRIGAWLAVQDCHKYNITPRVLAPPYSDPPGISDHKFVTQFLGIGTHSDCGPNFPWDVLESDVKALTAGAASG